MTAPNSATRYPSADWVAERWWTRSAAGAETSRTAIVNAWIVRAHPPKPRKNEFRDEMKSWAGLLGGTSDWVRSTYGALASFLAGTNTAIDEPTGWLAFSRLCADYVDPLARFSAQFAEAAHQYRPRGIPNQLGNSVKSYELAVPRTVRTVMAAPAEATGVGGVVDTATTADSFIGDPNAHQDRYLPIALRRYASILLDKRVEFESDESVVAAFDARLAELAVYGDPDEPRRKPTQSEICHVDRLLATQLRDAPRPPYTRRLRDHPNLAAGYQRARKVLLRQIIDGSEPRDASVIYLKLKGVGQDDARSLSRLTGHEIGVPEFFDAAVAARETGYAAVEGADIVARAAVALRELTGWQPSWEVEFAYEWLTGGASARPPFEEIRAAVTRAWQSSGRGARPPGALAVEPANAAGLVCAMLLIAVSAVTETDDLAELSDPGAVGRVAVRFDEAAALLAHYGVDDARGEQ
ncbi:hypothetical protein [Nocardia salmonicida]|uniref:hypothetical protein n=1 Tax=Nocardia salmonicida TaxID=53431 RepID=UPI003CE83438